MNSFEKIVSITNKYKDYIPEKDYEQILDFFKHDEWGLAFELLCVVLEQDKIKVDAKSYQILSQLGTYMGYEQGFWSKIIVEKIG